MIYTHVCIHTHTHTHTPYVHMMWGNNHTNDEFRLLYILEWGCITFIYTFKHIVINGKHFLMKVYISIMLIMLTPSYRTTIPYILIYILSLSSRIIITHHIIPDCKLMLILVILFLPHRVMIILGTPTKFCLPNLLRQELPPSFHWPQVTRIYNIIYTPLFHLHIRPPTLYTARLFGFTSAGSPLISHDISPF